jgi:hypothetical protein
MTDTQNIGNGVFVLVSGPMSPDAPNRFLSSSEMYIAINSLFPLRSTCLVPFVNNFSVAHLASFTTFCLNAARGTRHSFHVTTA